MATLNLFTFNNYYNRVNKRFNTIYEYEENGRLLYSYQDRNFNPADGVRTTFVFNYNGVQPDYCIVTNEYNDIVSRWFVIEAVRTTGGQYMVSLLRDLISDYYDVVLNNPCFIEKATLNSDDPLIFNKENMTFNQVRYDAPHLLYDESKCPWIVGYIPQDTFDAEPTKTITATSPLVGGDAAKDYVVNGLETWEYLDYVGDRILELKDSRIVLDFGIASAWQKKADAPDDAAVIPLRLVASSEYADYAVRLNIEFPNNLNERTIQEWNASAENLPIYAALSRTTFTTSAPTQKQYVDALVNGMRTLDIFDSRLAQAFRQKAVQEGYNTSAYSSLENINGKTLYDSATGIYYKISFVKVQNEKAITVPLTREDQLFNLLNVCITSNPIQDYTIVSWPAVQSNTAFQVAGLCNEYSLSLIPISETYTATIETSEASPIPNLKDAPYKMFCLPYGSIECIAPDGTAFTSSKEAALQIAVSFSTTLGDAVFDLQLLPYLPMRSILSNGKPDFRRCKASTVKIKDTETISSCFCWCIDSSDSFVINDYLIEQGKTAQERKLNSETVMYRLCSPNGAGQFELDAEMNNGVSGWEVNYTYKPFQPFIQVKPLFGGLYGVETTVDYRGLILGGDFSLTQLSDAWANYQLNNKTYQEQFDREIQNLKVGQQLSRGKEAMSVLGGGVAGGMKGAAGGVWGAVAGAVVGTVTTGANMALNEVGRQETLDYKNDMFGFQLANIQAIPQSITKTAANVINNPLVPYVEKYECTEVEKQALLDKLKYNGMTVGRIGYITDYIKSEPTYIKGKMIRVEGIQDDYHIAEALANEINKGVFL